VTGERMGAAADFAPRQSLFDWRIEKLLEDLD
jgi:hypothetical protein